MMSPTTALRPAKPSPEAGCAQTPALMATDVRMVFADGKQTVEVLKGVSLELAPGEVVALEGPSGSGKTTLLIILGCLLTPTSGQVMVDGVAVNKLRPEQLPAIRRRSIGFVFQQFNLFPALTARENVEYALNIKGTNGAAARRETEAVLEAVGLGDRMEFLPRNLSGGQKQRVAVARALAGRPPVLLADEPTANLDTSVGLHILQLFRDLAKREQRSLLIVTHDPKVRDIADRVLRIRRNHCARGGAVMTKSIGKWLAPTAGWRCWGRCWSRPVCWASPTPGQGPPAAPPRPSARRRQSNVFTPRAAWSLIPTPAPPSRPNWAG